MSAVVYKNQWTGEARAILPGTEFIIPGWEKRLVDVSLKNEPSDPPPTKAITADPIEIEVDYIIHSFLIPFDPEGDDASKEKTKQAVVKVATKVDYGERQNAVSNRIQGAIQTAFGNEEFDEIYPKNGDSPDAKRSLNKELIKRIADEVNATLAESVEEEWGIHVEIKIENVDFPGKIGEAIEEAVVAEREGRAIADKAEKAGVSPNLIAIGEMVVDGIRALKGK